jgi:hypothetical protein
MEKEKIKFVPYTETKKDKLFRILKENDIKPSEALMILDPYYYKRRQ